MRRVCFVFFVLLVLMGVTTGPVLAKHVGDPCGIDPLTGEDNGGCDGACGGVTNCTYACNPTTNRCTNSINNHCTAWADNSKCILQIPGPDYWINQICVDGIHPDTQVLACGSNTSGQGDQCREPGSIAAPAADCNQTGLLGKYSEVGGLKATNYSCGPGVNNITGDCGAWYGNWDGYFNAPVEGDYQFLTTMFPAGTFQIDLNNDGVLDACPNNNTVRGDRYLSYSNRGWISNDQSIPKWVRMYLNRGTDPQPGWTIPGTLVGQLINSNGCNGDTSCYQHYPEKSRNLQWWYSNYSTDYFGIDLGTATQKEWYATLNDSNPLPWDVTYPGLSDSDMTAGWPWIPPNETLPANRSSNYGGGECVYYQAHGYNDQAQICPGNWNCSQPWMWVKRHLTVGTHLVHFGYVYNTSEDDHTQTPSCHYNNFWYKGPSDTNFKETIDLTGAACPFSPCNTPPVAPPTNLQGSCVVNSLGTGVTATVSWDPGTGTTYNSVRVDDKPVSWEPGACPGTPATTSNTGLNGDKCLNLPANTYTFDAISGDTYQWWVHGRTDSNAWIPSDLGGVPGINFTCPAVNAAPTAIFDLRNGSYGPQIPVEAGNRNHNCQADFRPNNRMAYFEVQGKDLDGGRDISEIRFKLVKVSSGEVSEVRASFDSSGGAVWGAQADVISGDWTGTFSSGAVGGPDRWAAFGLNLPISMNDPSLYQMWTKVTDIHGAVSGSIANGGWVDTGRTFKIWDCKVPVSGNIYEVDQGNVCGGYNNRSNVSMELNYQNTVFTGLGGAGTVTVNKDSSYFWTYTSTSAVDKLIWGSTYAASLNDDLHGTQPNTVALVNLETGITTCQGDIQLAVGQNQTDDPYVASPYLKVDLASVKNQSPWWQVNGAGMMSSSLISNRIPVTCVGPGCVSAIINENTNIGVSSDGVVMGQNISNSGGCDLDGNSPPTGCRYSSPRNNFKPGIDGRPDTVNFNSLYTKLYLNSGIGKTYPGGTNYSDITTDASNGGVAFVNGDLLIDGDNTIASGNFLMVVVNGSIGISLPANNVEGVLVSEGNINIGETSDTALNINGIVYSNRDIKIQRGYKNPLAEPNNNDDPAVKFNYRPDLLFNMPVEVSRVLANWRVGQ